MGKGNWLNLAHEKNLEMCSANTEAVPRIERKSYRSIDPGSWNWPWIWRAGTWKKMKKKGPGIRFSNFKGLERAVESIINGNPVIIFSNIQSSNPVIIFSRCNTVRVADALSSNQKLTLEYGRRRKKTQNTLWNVEACQPRNILLLQNYMPCNAIDLIGFLFFFKNKKRKKQSFWNLRQMHQQLLLIARI